MRILAVGAHPDDLEAYCFGTLALHAKRGDDVFICGVANGNLGHMVIQPKELAEIRYKEAEKAARMIGAKEYFNLGVGDLQINGSDEELVRKMVDVIREVRPDYIITHRTDEYHRDHNETGNLVFHASFASSCPHYFTNKPNHATVPPIYYMYSSSPSFVASDYVDISEVIDLKLAALACHESQMKWLAEHDNMDFLGFIRSADRGHGSMCQVEYAEVFHRCMQQCRITASRLLP